MQPHRDTVAVVGPVAVDTLAFDLALAVAHAGAGVDAAGGPVVVGVFVVGVPVADCRQSKILYSYPKYYP